MKRMTSGIIGLALWTATLATGPAETYSIDPVHSYIGFSVSHLGLAKVRGKFADYQGRIDTGDGTPGAVSVEGAIQVASIDTGSEGRDTHLRGDDFFAADAHPTITFASKRIEEKAGGRVMHGVFTLRGVSRDIEFPFELAGPIEDPWGKRRIGLSARLTISRRDYGVGSDKASDGLIGDDVHIELDFEAVAEKPKTEGEKGRE